MSSPHALHSIPLVTSAGARELDARTIASLPDSYTLMLRAGDAAAQWLHARTERSVAVYAGPGNNGGDGWVIAGLLRQMGWSVRVHDAGPPRAADAIRARADAERDGPFATPTGTEPIVLDALLGTGASGPARGAIASALAALRHVHASPYTLIAIDMPTALDATTGDDAGAVAASHTLTFGSLKQGQLLRRDLTGELHVLDIGLVDAGREVPRVVGAHHVATLLPAQPHDAYKGTRGRVAIVGGGAGMAGAVILAARGAHGAGAGMVRADVAQASALALQIAVPFATVRSWDALDFSAVDTRWPGALVIGPGLDGTDSALRNAVLSLLHSWRGPVVLDAGALSCFAAPRDGGAAHRIAEEDIVARDAWAGGDDVATGIAALRHALRGREALLTPHAGEFAALGGQLDQPAARFSAACALAEALGVAVLLKGVPTVIAAPDGASRVTATGNVALAMGGTGDLLAGMAGALLAQGMSATDAGVVAAWVHGRAAERATERHGGWRGVTMERLIDAVADVWPTLPLNQRDCPTAAPSLLDLPAVPAR